MRHLINSRSLIKIFCLFLIFLLTGLFSCKDSTKPKEPSIIGAWDLTRYVSENADGSGYVREGEILESTYREHFIFNADGTGESYDHFGLVQITWEIKDSGSLYLYYLDGTTSWIYSNYTLTECHFTIILNWDSGNKETRTFTRRDSDCN